MSELVLPAVTLTDPWASLCVAGVKTLESRKGPLLSRFMGTLVIHRSKAPCAPHNLARWGLSVPMRPEGWPEDDAGMALGVVFVQGTRRHVAEGLIPISEEERRQACFENLEGRYLSELTCAAWFPRPIPAQGAQSRFKISVPADFVPVCMGGCRDGMNNHAPHAPQDEETPFFGV